MEQGDEDEMGVIEGEGGNEEHRIERCFSKDRPQEPDQPAERILDMTPMTPNGCSDLRKPPQTSVAILLPLSQPTTTPTYKPARH